MKAGEKKGEGHGRYRRRGDVRWGRRPERKVNYGQTYVFFVAFCHFMFLFIFWPLFYLYPRTDHLEPFSSPQPRTSFKNVVHRPSTDFTGGSGTPSAQVALPARPTQHRWEASLSPRSVWVVQRWFFGWFWWQARSEWNFRRRYSKESGS